MKRMVLPLLLIGTGAFAQSTYNGNGKTGFGGTIGNGSLLISDNGTNITATLTTGGTFNDVLVVYFDSQSGGVVNTSTINDDGDALRKSISGNDGSNVSEVNFPAGFTADYALAFDNAGSGLFRLTPGGTNSLTFINYVSGTGARTFAKTDIGITGTISFKLVGTYTSNTAYRSNEALVQDVGNGSESGGNFGRNPITFNTSNDYPQTALNITLRQFNARRNGQAVAINWQASCTGSYANFELERSKDGRSFSPVYSEKASASRCNAPFAFEDVNAGASKTFYRLKMTSDAGKITYSNIATIMANGAGGGITLTLQPSVVNRTAMLQINGGTKGNLNISIVESSGRIVSSQRMMSEGGSQSVMLPTEKLTAGIYTVIVNDDNMQNKQTLRFVKQ
jgi:hypothetical protein